MDKKVVGEEVNPNKPHELFADSIREFLADIYIQSGTHEKEEFNFDGLVKETFLKHLSD